MGPRVGGMWQGPGVCGRMLRHVAGCGDMWHGWWQGVGACGRGLDTS